MTRKEFAKFIDKLKEAENRGDDLDAIVKEHENENVYVYNDACFKKIFASEKNTALTADLVNAALDLHGDDRIENPQLVNPFTPGEVGYRNSEPDLLLTNERGGKRPRDRISIEIQHEDRTLFKNRVVLYVARLTSNMVKKNEPPVLENLNLLAFQFFNAFPWKKSRKYRHTVQLHNQDMQLYFDKQAITIVEVQKFYHHVEAFADDHSRLAQWLRAIDTLNRGADFSEFANDPVFRVLQNEVKLCNFSSRYLMMEGMNMVDMALERFEAKVEVAKNLLRDGDPAERVARNTGIPLYTVLDLKKKMRRRRATR